MNNKHSACTSMIVGKTASIDGSVIIARNEDFHTNICPKVFLVQPACSEENRVYKSLNTGVKIPLPEESFRYTCMPESTAYTKNSEGVYAEAGINEVNVAVSSSESLYGNTKVLAYDPLVETGIAEDAINDIVLPFIDSAKAGVDRLGKLIEEFGSAEGNGVLFADSNEAWYMEIPTGHHWVAIRIPDDCYAVAPNHVCIENIDFSKPDQYKWSTNIQEFVKKYNLNPDVGCFNFRHIFGTSSELDRVYNTPRSWFAQKYLTPNIEQSPISTEISFLQKANRLISVEDVEYVLSSHYNETAFDPLGYDNSEMDKTRFRSVSLARTAESHILQIRNGVTQGVCGIKWISMGTNAFTPYVPFFTNILQTPKAYAKMTKLVSTDNAYWLFKQVGHFVGANYHALKSDNVAYLNRMQSYARRRIEEVTETAKYVNANELPTFLTAENKKTADFVLSETREYLSDLMKQSFSYSKLTFTMDKNL